MVGFARYSQDRSFVVLGQNRRFVVVMAVGSIVGAFVGGRLLGLVPSPVLLVSGQGEAVAAGEQGTGAG